MPSDPLLETLTALRDEIPPALHRVLDAFSADAEDAPEEAWQQLLRETLDEG